ncbi:o-succinylbenzoate--CoA ligase [Arsenicicoccus dermatophilus]|uniref:o-succinylbenzoate--CoA ligase n=1 Tax=Arsenicicoccus dermatophilus TaxID=1076331 RepID=UPI001F4C6356|nr:o-succinylbenzoate--CoA ligase [Arsenicicoccus dermatophilus]
MQLVAWPPSPSPADAVRDPGPLERALTGAGPAVCPSGVVAESPGDAAVVVGTSGSTGTPKLAVLSAAAVRASGQATAEHLGGQGQWLLALPPTHVAGLQVLARSLLAGHTPVAVTDGPFTPEVFAEATARLAPGTRHHTSLVPTQLVRLLASRAGTEAAASYDAILVGGAALPASVHAQALAAGLRIVRTYGMSETCGGCVYDGKPLPATAVRLTREGRVELGGPVVMDGYLGRPDLTAAVLTTDERGTRWFRTDDLGEVAPGGTLTVLGRADDLITTGGLKVAPRVVEDAILAHVTGIRESLVVGVPDPDWGQAVGVLLVGEPGAEDRSGDVPALRELLRPHLPGHALPRRVRLVAEMPLRGPGKPDRAAARELLSD